MAEFQRLVSDREILAVRSEKNDLDPRRPYAYFVEPERTADGEVCEVATIFLTNRECPFRCLMCDLWRNTLDASVPEGAIGDQIDYALLRLGHATHIKLYNSGNFFDRKAIPPGELPAIAARLAGFDRVIVECHPRLCRDDCFRFQDQLVGDLEVAMGLETVQPDVLARLNKQMTLDDYDRAVSRLRGAGIAVRAFILLRPPFVTEEEGIHWAIRSLRHAFEVGVECCTVIPTRSGNGILELLAAEGRFAPPTLSSLEVVQEEGIRMRQGRVFVDLWDCDRFYECEDCGPRRKERMYRMNLEQRVLPEIHCDRCTAYS